jgi:four helix bundle protein
LADEFETEVTRLILNSPTASRDFRYRGELFEALSSVPANLAEGYSRRSPREKRRFFEYALASLSEVEVRLSSGIKPQHVTAAECAPAFLLAKRTLTATVRFQQSQVDYLKQMEARRTVKGH